MQRKRCRVGMGVQTTDRKIGLGECEGKEAEGGREGGRWRGRGRETEGKKEQLPSTRSGCKDKFICSRDMK